MLQVSTALAPRLPRRPPRDAQPDPHRLLRYSGVILGVPGAVCQVGYGVQQWRAATAPHERLNAAVDVVSGAAHGTASSVTFGSATAALLGFATVTQAITVCAWFHGAAILLDAVRDLYNGVHVGERREIEMGAAKLASVGIMAAGLAAGSPALMVAGDLLNDGAIAWQNRGAIEEAFARGWHALAGRLTQG